MLLEVCASNYQSAINAQKAEAHRIELCSELDVGGVTPSHSLIRQVMNSISIPVFVLIRPRRGNFTYSEVEFEKMKQSIQGCKNLGCSGIVSGVLNNDNTINIVKTKELIELSKPLVFTFHRAFDEVINPFEGLEQLIDLGVNRILTSGQETSAENGINFLKEMSKIASGRITILPGAGINPNNVNLFKKSGFKEVHASASGDSNISNIETIKSILKIINE